MSVAVKEALRRRERDARLNSMNILELKDYVQTQRDDHFNSIKNTSILQLRTMRRKNYVPRQRSPEELRLEARYKVSWREPGPVNLEFQKAGILRPKVLNTWELDRVERPTKCYEKRILSKFKID